MESRSWATAPPGRAHTLLNYCGIRTDFLDYTVDRNPVQTREIHRRNQFPIFAPVKIRETKPDYVSILPWNLKEENYFRASYIQKWNGKCVVPIPDVRSVTDL